MNYWFRIFWITIVLGALATVIWASPPTDITMDFDQKAGTLHLEMTHFVVRTQHIRKTVVFVNGKKSATVYTHAQLDPRKFEQDIPVTAKAGDEISVDIYASEGGAGHAKMTVPQEEEGK